MERDDFNERRERDAIESQESTGGCNRESGESESPSSEIGERPLDAGLAPIRSVFDPMAGVPGNSEGTRGPFGAASISLLLDLLVERTRAQAWSIERQRAHARALLHLSREYWFSDEESAVLCAFLG
jgi:hypothetical protein